MYSFLVSIPYLMFVIIQNELIQGELKFTVHLLHAGSRFRREVEFLNEWVDEE